MLSLHHVDLTLSRGSSSIQLLEDIHLFVPAGHLMAIVGPSGCGKSTLLKTIAGISPETGGEVCWQGKALSQDGEIAASELGYVPQFSIAFDHLNVEESIEAATRLRIAGSYDERWDRIEQVLTLTGLEGIAQRPVRVLSGGQKRRLGLAMELVSNPSLLLCDEVTSGLDPRSEEEIVGLLHQIARGENRLVLSVTHSLSHLSLYDSVLVLFAGRVAYHGSAKAMTHYFGVEHPEDIYPTLAQREPDSWAKSWHKHAGAYYRKILTEQEQSQFYQLKQRFSQKTTSEETEATATQQTPPSETPTEQKTTNLKGQSDLASQTNEQENSDPAPETPAQQPGFFTQFLLIFTRRWKIFFRDRTTLILHLAILVGFPALVAAFGNDQPEAIRQLSTQASSNIQQEFTQRANFQNDMARTGGWVSGVIMFQVVLLTLMAANNSAREIAGERNIVEKEKLGGLSPAAYLSGKIAFLVFLVAVQSLWMAGFVEQFFTFAGSFANHFFMLFLVNASITSICLGISSLMKNPDQANLLSIYLVGFQLPLSGAILALPAWLAPVAQPLISAYWAWSGSISSLAGVERSAVMSVTPTQPASFSLACLLLGIHLLVGLTLCWIGIKKRSWSH